MKKKKKKILIADADLSLHRKLKQSKHAACFQFDAATTGFDCWTKIESFEPDLIVVDLMLPHIHGMEILRKVKMDPRTQHIGVILISYCPSSQNYHSAMMNHVDFYLEKPFELSRFFSLVHQFFKHNLHPEPFYRKSLKTHDGPFYQPKIHTHTSYLKFWGTRGSNPVAGPDYVRYGGNTSCLEVCHDGEMLIFDAGTGIRQLGCIINEKPPKDIHIILSHFHFDHLSGFPFFQPIYNPACHIHVWTPIGFEKIAREIFSEMLTYALFPVRLDDMQAQVTFKDIQERIPFQIGNFIINAHYAFHPGATLCFAIECNKKRFGYVTDNEFLMGYHGNPHALTKKHHLLAPYESFIAFFKACDFLIHEAQYTPAEYRNKVGWGHSSMSNAAALIQRVETDDWIITHHDPQHTDAEMFKKTQLQYDILDDLKINCRVRTAFDSLTIPL